jgi:hypothetical protein
MHLGQPLPCSFLQTPVTMRHMRHYLIEEGRIVITPEAGDRPDDRLAVVQLLSAHRMKLTPAEVCAFLSAAPNDNGRLDLPVVSRIPTENADGSPVTAISVLRSYRAGQESGWTGTPDQSRPRESDGSSGRSR